LQRPALHERPLGLCKRIFSEYNLAIVDE
jgi:hypothetical protein